MTARIPAVLLLAVASAAGHAADTRGTPPTSSSGAIRPHPSATVSTTDALAEVQEIAKAGRVGEAMRRLEVLVAARPNDPRLLFQKGVMLVDQKRGAEAIQVFQKLMRDYPALPEPMNNLAVLYVERGDMEKARTTLEAAIRSKPNYGTAFQNLGDLYTRMASRAYARALQIDEADASPKLALIRNLYEPPRPEADATWMAQAPAAAPITQPDLRPAVPPAASVPPPVVTAAAPAQPPTTPAPTVLPAPRTAAAEPASRPTPATTATAGATVAAGGGARVAGSAPSKPVPAAASVTALTPPAPASAAAAPAKPPPRPPTVVVPPPAQPSADVAEVNAALRNWVSAWSRRDMAGYIAAYVPGFKGSDATADAWQAGRRARILGKASIRVEVSGVKVDVDKNTATAAFRQAYAAGGLEVNSRKTLEFVRLNGKWLIRRESVGG